MTPFQDAWSLLKNITDMVEYPEGSGNFMALKDMHEARNAQSRVNLADKYPIPYTDAMRLQLQRMDSNMQGRRESNVGGQPSTNALAGNQQRNNIMVDSKTGVYDPNDPNSLHPMGSGQ